MIPSGIGRESEGVRKVKTIRSTEGRLVDGSAGAPLTKDDYGALRMGRSWRGEDGPISKISSMRE